MKINPTRTVLLVIDMQRDFYAEGGNAVRRAKQVKQMQALPSKINSFARQLRSAGMKVVFTKFMYDPRRTPKNLLEKAAKGKSWMCEVNTDGAELAGVYPTNDDIVIEKLSYDCFAGTDLIELCRTWHSETIIITGVRTEICVLHTVLRSFAEGFQTIVAKDLIGTYDNKSSEVMLTYNILKYASYLMTSQDIQIIIEKSTSSS